MKPRVCFLILGIAFTSGNVDLPAQTNQLPALSEASIEFNTDVRPILATHCFPCHGPDEAKREADLRLDSFAGATADLEDYQAIKPGEPDDSELVQRIEASDPDDRMPPREFNKPLTAGQIQVLRKWIESGAKYQTHWAFVAPGKSPIPEIDAQQFPAWSTNAVDRFILKKMLDEQLTPSPAASPSVLVRRLFLDLTGLPPTVEESDQWQHELTTPPHGISGFNRQAYERLVDHLLSSPHYGERWARRWLDLARYADTNGYEKDRPRSIWPYRIG